MKKTILFILIIWSTCTTSMAQEGFRIIGKLGGSLEGPLYLISRGAEGAGKLGETMMTNGNFKFTGKVPEPTIAYIVTDKQQPIATLMLENREFTLTAGTDGIVVEGGEEQKMLNEFEALNKTLVREKFRVEQEAKAAYAQQNQMKLQNLSQQFEKTVRDIQTQQLELLRKYGESPVAAYVMASAMGQMNFEQLTENYNLLGEKAKASFFGKVISVQLALYKQVSVGSIAPDFKAATLNDDTLSLHAIKAKVKLIDFWASWCEPCRQEIPHLRKIYQKYREKGLEIVGFSLDNKKQEWAKAMKDEKMSWKNLSDLRGQASGIAALYCIKSIPHTLLLDENNQIIAKDLRGKNLQKKIEELLGGK